MDGKWAWEEKYARLEDASKRCPSVSLVGEYELEVVDRGDPRFWLFSRSSRLHSRKLAKTETLPINNRNAGEHLLRPVAWVRDNLSLGSRDNPCKPREHREVGLIHWLSPNDHGFLLLAFPYPHVQALVVMAESMASRRKIPACKRKLQVLGLRGGLLSVLCTTHSALG
jgi:hypothetical protein